MRGRAAARVREAVDGVLFGPESPARLAFVHTALAVLVGLRVVLGPYRRLDPTPAGLFRPPWFLAWLPGMPDAALIGAVQVVGGVAAALFVARRWPRASFAVAWLAYLFLAGLRDSRGKVLHNDVLLLLASVPFLAAPLDTDRGDRVPAHRTGWPVRCGMVVGALAYFFAGYWKLVRSGLAWVFSDNVRLSIAWGPKPEVDRWDAFADAVTATAWVGVVVAAATLVFELTYPVALFLPRARPAYLVVGTALHLATYLVFGLDYWAWIGTSWVLLVDWPALGARWRAVPRGSPSTGTAGGTVAGR